MRFLVFLLSFFIFTSFGNELKFPKLTGPVVDEAKFLNNREKQALSEKIYSFYQAGGYQIQILTVNNLSGYPIEEYSIRLGEAWKIGRKKEGDGVLIVIAKDERALRIEVGQGIEDKITDYQSSQILQNILIPAFAQGQFFGGLSTTLDHLTGSSENALAPKPKVTPQTRVQHNIPSYFAPLFFVSFFLYIISYNFFSKNKPVRVTLTMVFFGIIAFIIFQTIAHVLFALLMGLLIGVIGPLNFLILLMHSSGRGGRGGGGFGGGGSWGGGGGGFSGGGASGRW